MLKSFFLAVMLLLSSAALHAQEIITAATNGDLSKVKELVEKDQQLVNVKDANVPGRSSHGGKCWVSATFIEELRPN